MMLIKMVGLGKIKSFFTPSGSGKPKVLKSNDNVSDINQKSQEALNERRRRTNAAEKYLKGGSTIKKKK